MGGVLSSHSATVPAQQTNTDESKPPTDTTQTTPTLPVETIHQTVTEPVNEPIVPVATEVLTPTETKPEEVLERYVEPTGTKVEVAPVEVAPAADVVRKGKKKNKKHH